MARMGKFGMKELEKLQQKLNEVHEAQVNAFCEACAKELAERLLRKVIKRTPVGDYSDTYDIEDDGEKKFLVMSDKKGGTLKKAWTSGKIRKEGTDYIIDIINPMHYATYVEYGHRQTPGRYVPAIGKKLKKGWVMGHLMMTYSEKEIQTIAPKLLEKRIEKFLGDMFK